MPTKTGRDGLRSRPELVAVCKGWFAPPLTSSPLEYHDEYKIYL